MSDKLKLPKPVIVQKFGGSSIATPEQIKFVAKRLRSLHAKGHHLIVVVSAMGKTTDDLTQLARTMALVPDRREFDMLLSTGERISMSLLAMALNDIGVKAISFTGSQAGLFTTSAHSNAHITDIKPFRVEEELRNDKVVVLAGFQGVSPQTKEITTLGRGGSDTTAVAMAAHFQAQSCEILKDVDGVYSADPRVVPNAKHLAAVSYQQLLEMTFWGAKVLHYRSVELALRRSVPLTISLTHGKGLTTTVQKDVPMFEQDQVLSINTIPTVLKLNVFTSQPTKGLEVFGAFLKNHNLPWPQILSCEGDLESSQILFTTSSETIDSIKSLLHDKGSMQLGALTYSAITMTCAGWVGTNTPLEACQTLMSKHIIVYKMIISSLSVSLFVESSMREQATQTLHSRFVR